MKKHVSNYLKAFGYDTSDIIKCEMCPKIACDIHHIEPRSSFGSNRKKEQDDPSNLIALCRDCHNDAHGPRSQMYRDIFRNHVKLRKK